MTEQLKVRFFKLHKNAISPTQAHDTDAGWDIYYCPSEENSAFVSVAFGKSVLLGTGIKCEIPDGYYLEVKNRSSMSVKQGILVGAGIIDKNFDGELKVNLQNVTGNGLEKIEPFQKIAQMVLLPKPKYIWEESLIDDLNQNSQRGEKGFGSSGKF